MTPPRFLRPVVIALAIAAPVGLAIAQKSTEDGKYSQPNLVAADRLCAQALLKIEAAQAAKESDPGGHAERAKMLLSQAQAELKNATKHATKKKGRSSSD